MVVYYYTKFSIWETQNLSHKLLVNSACQLVTYVGKDLVRKLVSNLAKRGAFKAYSLWGILFFKEVNPGY